MDVDEPERNIFGYYNYGPGNQEVKADTGNWVDQAGYKHDTSADYVSNDPWKYIAGGLASDNILMGDLFRGISVTNNPKDALAAQMGLVLFGAKYISPINAGNKRTREDTALVPSKFRGIGNPIRTFIPDRLPSNQVDISPDVGSNYVMPGRHYKKTQHRTKRHKSDVDKEVLSQMLKAMFPTRLGWQEWCITYANATSTTGLAQQNTIGATYDGASSHQSYVFCSNDMLVALSKYANNSATANLFTPTTAGTKLWVDKLELSTTLRNPGNNPVYIEWFTCKAKNSGHAIPAADYTPRMFAVNSISQTAAGLGGNEPLTNVRTSLAITDIDLDIRKLPGWRGSFDIVESGKLCLQPEQFTIIKQRVNHRMFVSKGMLVGGTDYEFAGFEEFLHVKSWGQISNISSLINTSAAITYPPHSIDVLQRLYFKGRQLPTYTNANTLIGRIASIPISAVGAGTDTDAYYPGGVVGATYTEVQSRPTNQIP